MTAFVRARQLANLVNLSTPLGLLIAAASKTPLQKGVHGLSFGTNYRPKLPRAGAFTVGNVVFFRSAEPEETLIEHEARHATQYSLCLGLPFFPLYFAGAAWSWWRTGEVGSRNPFERWAGLAEGGYRESETIRRFSRLFEKFHQQNRTQLWRRAIP